MTLKTKVNTDAIGQTNFMIKNFQGMVTKKLNVELPETIKGINNTIE